MFDSTTSAAEPAQVAPRPRRWDPHDANGVARAIHELAAWQYDDEQIERWHRVLELLRAGQAGARRDGLTR